MITSDYLLLILVVAFVLNETNVKMHIAIDIGNTFAKIAFFEGNTLLRFEKGVKIENLAQLIDSTKYPLVISSVTKTTQELEQIFEAFEQKLLLDPTTALPIQNNYDTPHTLGADRLAAAVGAHFLFPKQHCLIIDMGTAIKYDYVSKAGVFEGGIISPGMKIRFQALHTFTKRLPLLEAEGIPPLIGKSTKGCIQSGVVNGIIQEANGLMAEYKKKRPCKVILSGGDATFFEMSLKKPTFVIPEIVLIGLNQILSHHLKDKAKG